MIATRLIALAGALLASPAPAETPRAPALAAASSFGQTWAPEMLAGAFALGVTDLRDEVFWKHVTRDGRDRFDWPINRYPALLPDRGMSLSVIVNNGHPDFDSGATPTSPEAVAAFAGYAARLAAEFPAIVSIEVGNEMNSDDFTSGAMRAAGLDARARLYTALLAATRAAVKAENPDARIIGGAALAMPLAWFAALAEAGAPAHMDSLALHPYTTPPEQFRRQLALLRAIPGYAALPVEVTEFGTPDPAQAPAYLMKYHCQMALAGVTRAVWYPLNPRGDGMAALLTPEGTPTKLGRTFQLLQGLTGLPVQDAAPDPFTYACQFGPGALVIWGADRAVTLGEGLAAHDPTGRPVTDPRLSRDTPLLITTAGPEVRLGETVRLGPQIVIADSFDQFAYPGQTGDGFQRFARAGGASIPFTLGPGQETGGVPWTPYLGTTGDGMLRMDAEFLMPSMHAAGPAEIVHRFTAPGAMRVSLAAFLDPAGDKGDGLVLTVELNGVTLARRHVTRRATLDLVDLALARGDRLDIVTGPGATPEGDDALYRFTLSRAP